MFEPISSETSSNGEDGKGSEDDMEDSDGKDSNDNIQVSLSNGESADIRREVFRRAINQMNTTSIRGGETPYELVYGGKRQFDDPDESSELEYQQWVAANPNFSPAHVDKYEAAVALQPLPLPTKETFVGKSIANLQGLAAKGIRKVLLTVKTIRRILNAKESIMKYGVFIPRNDGEAEASPEHLRWESGRMLEWMRLQEQGTFERNWDWPRIQKKYPTYQRKDIGHVFFVYDFKHSGEHRVRLVFDGSRQNPETYTETYAPTARGESVRLFHVFAVEEGWEISQYDVPQVSKIKD
jgi:hypothetical protein